MADVVKDVDIGEANSPDKNESAAKSRADVLRTKDKERSDRETRIKNNQKELTNASALESVRRTKTILSGKIIGVEELTLNGNLVVTAAILGKNKTKMNVPFEEMYTETVIDMSTVDLNTENGKKQYIQRQRQMLAKMLGLPIEMCILRVIKNYDGLGHDTILGSRREAAALLRDLSFNPDSPHCKEGEIYNAKIISVSPHSLAATFNGVDFVVPQSVLSNRFILDLQMYYKPGDKLPFRMDDLKITKDGVSFKANTLAAELQECRNRYGLITVNTIARAVITRIRRNNASKRIEIYAWLPDYELPCRIVYMSPNDFGREIVSGDEVQVVISRFTENGYLEARCRSLHGNSSLFGSY